MTACSSTGAAEEDNENILTDGIRKAGESATGFAGGGALTEDDSLQGERTFGVDEYAGTYQAEYQGFSGREILFGGTSLERKSGDTLQIQSDVNAQSGEIKVYWNSGESEPELLFKGAGEHSATIQLKGGWEYLSIRGPNLQGTFGLKWNKELGVCERPHSPNPTSRTLHSQSLLASISSSARFETAASS